MKKKNEKRPLTKTYTLRNIRSRATRDTYIRPILYLTKMLLKGLTSCHTNTWNGGKIDVSPYFWKKTREIRWHFTALCSTKTLFFSTLLCQDFVYAIERQHALFILADSLESVWLFLPEYQAWRNNIRSCYRGVDERFIEWSAVSGVSTPDGYKSVILSDSTHRLWPVDWSNIIDEA